MHVIMWYQRFQLKGYDVLKQLEARGTRLINTLRAIYAYRCQI